MTITQTTFVVYELKINTTKVWWKKEEMSNYNYDSEIAMEECKCLNKCSYLHP